MNSPLICGLVAALVGLLLTLVEYFAGLHTVEKLGLVNHLNWVKLVIPIVAIVIAQRGRRATNPGGGLSFGQGFGTGMLVTLWMALAGAVTTFLYMKFINPGFSDTMIEFQLAQAQAKGMEAAQLDAAEKGMRMFMSPVMMSVFSVFGSALSGAIISLISAAILKRQPAAEMPPEIPAAS